MRKKEEINNNCRICEHSAKEYLCIKNKLVFVKTSFCMKIGLSPREKKQRVNDKVKCEHFKLAEASVKERLCDIKDILNETNKQLSLVAKMLSELDVTDDTND